MSRIEYRGERHPDGTTHVYVTQDGEYLGRLAGRPDLIGAEDQRMGWSRRGGGQRTLAIAILAHATGEDRLALRLYGAFSRQVVYTLPWPGWSLDAGRVARWVAAQGVELDT